MLINKTPLGTRITAIWKTYSGTLNTIEVTVDVGGNTYNVTGTGSLNADGRKALKQVLAVADIILERGEISYV